MARDPQKFKLGVFVLTGIAATLTILFVLGANQWLRATKTVYCYFAENVQGLAAGSDVSYRGVNIGKVESVMMIAAARDQQVAGSGALIEVKCVVYPDALGLSDLILTDDEFADYLQQWVDRGVRVTLAWKDITGSKYISIDHYDIDKHPYPVLAPAMRQPFIPTAAEASFEDIQRDLATTLGKLARVDYEAISARMVDLLELTTQRVEALDTQALQGHAEETLIAMRRIAEDPALRRALDRMDSITERFDHTSERLDTLISDPRVDRTLEDVSAASASVRNITAELDRALPNVVAKLEGLLDQADQTLRSADVSGTSAAVRDAASQLGNAADDVAAVRGEVRRLVR